MVKFQDYYEVLGVPRDADADAIKKAYRKLALKWHPDRHQGAGAEEAEKRFKELNEAYEVLSDQEKRTRYDRFGANWQHGQDFTPPPGASQTSREDFERAFGGSGGFSDFFSQMFGDQFRANFGGSRRRHARYSQRGSDVKAELELEVGRAIAGGKSRFSFPARVSCERCGGVGFVGEHVCPVCAGVGRVTQTRTVDLKIPADVRDGLELRLRGLGETADEASGEPGDLYLTLRLASDDTYRLRGADLEADVPLAPWELLSGAKVDVRTPRGVVTATIPARTRAGKRLRLREQGFADGRGGRGDFYVVVRLALPESLSARQEELLRELARAAPPGSRVAGGARVQEPPQ